MRTQKITLVVLTLCLGIHLSAQESIEKEVDQQLWKPFIESWTSNDYEAFNALHTDDVLRVSKSGLRLGKEYKERNEVAMKRNASTEIKRSIQFWLEHRIYKGDMGYEVGYYKVIGQRPGQEAQTFYARFHIVIKKVNGKWKIAQDWDTDQVNGVPITEEDWKKGKPLSF